MAQSRSQPMADGTALQLMSTGTSSIPPIGPRKLVERESEITKLESAVLYPRLVLLEALTRFKDGLKQRAMSSDKTREARRDFLDSFAYLCDVEKGGKTVTATALQMMEVETGDCLWLAANEGIREEVLFYAQKILKRAKAATVETLRVVQDRILTLSVKKCRPRIHFYRDAIKRHALQCNEALECVERDDVVNLLRTKLGQLLEHPPSTNLEAYVDLCYGMRGEHIRAIRSYSKTAEDGFSQLAHHIYRLGATRDAANKVVEAMTLVPSLQKISKIQIVNTPRIVKKTVSPVRLIPHEVLYSVLEETSPSDPLKFQQTFLRLYHLDPLPSRPIYNHMASKEMVVTRVHAELQIADKFARSQAINFVDNDKYIGCSKPACYFCYTWLCLHTQGYSEPATHCKVIPGCRGPDYELNDAGTDVMLSMYRKISRQVGQDIFAFLEKDTPPPRVPYMSTDAGSRAPSRMSGF